MRHKTLNWTGNSKIASLIVAALLLSMANKKRLPPKHSTSDFPVSGFRRTCFHDAPRVSLSIASTMWPGATLANPIEC